LPDLWRVRLHALDESDDEVAVGEDSRRQLVQQRLEEVMVCAVKDGHIRVRASQRPSGEQTAEATAHDHDAMPAP